MHTCNWYISSSVSGVLAQVIKHMADALRTHSKDIDLHVVSAKDYGYKAGFELKANIFSRKEIWHLFGRAPWWWRIVRMHSRTEHTLLDGTKCGRKWLGYPSRFFTEGALNGEAVIFPVFDIVSSRSEEGKKAVYVFGEDMIDDIPQGDYEVLDIAGKVLRPEVFSGLYIARDTGPREAMRAGLLTVRGLAVASEKSGYLDEILGPGGYFLIEDDSDMERIIRQALGDKGRHTAMAARHFLKSRRSHDKCTESIITLYRRVIAQ